MMTKTSKTKTENLITKKELNQVFWRSFQMEFSWNYERQMNMAYVYAMIPILKKLYPQKEEMAAALKRHLAFFNTTPHIVTFILELMLQWKKKMFWTKILKLEQSIVLKPR